MTERRVARSARRALALAATLLAFALAAPASHAACEKDGGGVGGTGNAPGTKTAPSGKGKDRGGIGGTGRSERDAGGIGGTGRREAEEGGIGGTGIIGVITGFGSVCVNGLEVEYDAATPVDANGAASSTSTLAVGQVVVIEASARDGKLHADHIGVRSVAVGPVERVDARRGEMNILGQHVRIDPATHVVDASGRPAPPGDIAPGSFVAVSGLREADGSVAATRIEPVAPRDTVSVMGAVIASRAGGIAIGGLTIEAPRGKAAPPDRVALVIGRLDPGSGALHADRIEPAVRFTKPPDRIFVEGLVQDPTAKGFRTEHATVDATAIGTGAARPTPGARVVVGGFYAPDGSVRAERIEVVAPEAPTKPDPQHGGDDEQRDRDARGDRDDDHHENESVEHAEHGEHESGEKPEKVEKPEKAEKPETHESPEQPEHHEAPEQPEHHETPDRPETPDVPEVEHPESPEHVEKPETPEKPEVPETPEHVERPELPEGHEVERPETPELPEIERHEVERPETPERIEVERPETPERPEVERPEAPELPEVERPEAPEHDD